MTLYVSDLDGTLLRSDKTLSDESVNTLNRLMADGVMFTYATARSFSSAAPLVSALKLTTPAVIFNGVFVVDPKTGEHLIENIFSEESFELARDYFITNGLTPLVYSFIDGRERVSYLKDRLDEVRGYVESRSGDKRLRPVRSYRELFKGSVFYFTLLNPKSPEEADKIFSRENGFSRNYMKDTYDDSMWYEIFAAEASKAGALHQAAKLAGAKELVCFGDNYNDMSMILSADIGVAVSNACEELKRNADIVIGTNDEGAVAEFIRKRENVPKETSRFSEALGRAMIRQKGMHGSVGTQNEKLIHATLKNYYSPFSDEQEIKIGNFYADAVNENGIFEIQTRALKRLSEKLKQFTAGSHVNIVYPVEANVRTTYINTDTGEIVKETPYRCHNPKLKIFSELYSIREFIFNGSVSVILARLKLDKRVYFSGQMPDMRSRSARKKLYIEKIPLELLEEIRLDNPRDYARWLPENLPERFTKKDFCAAAKDSPASLRLELLRAAGLLEQVGKSGRSYVYSVKGHYLKN